MSQVFYESFSLEDMISRSSHILVVEAADPAYRKQDVEVDPGECNGKFCPSYSVHVRRFHVVDVVRAPEGFQEDPLEVASAGWRDSYTDHIEYYVEGIESSPIEFEYQAKGNLDGPRLIIFILLDPDGRFEFVVKQSVESVEFLDEVREVARSKPYLS